ARVGPLRHRVRQPGRRRAAQHRDLHEFLGQHGALSRRYVRGLADRDLPCPASAAGNVLLSLRRPPRADDRDAHGRVTAVDYRTIVVGTDGSVTATSALRAAVRFATRCKAKLVLVCAFDPPRISRAMAETVLEHAARSARGEGVEVEVETGGAEPAGLILGVAERRGAGLVVVGNKGIGEATRFRLGSVPDRVAQQAGCDVVVVGNKGMSGARRFLLGSVPNQLAHAVPTDILIVKTVDRALSDIAPGHGAVVTAGGRRLAVYRDDQGGLHAVSPRCTHMGCTVDSNDAERTWARPVPGP